MADLIIGTVLGCTIFGIGFAGSLPRKLAGSAFLFDSIQTCVRRGVDLWGLERPLRT